jgi:ubiquinone/menaquinone biosynthesis C-methylase UbiE
MERRDHHDWASETYVDEWVTRQQAEDPTRAERFQLMCDRFPFSPAAAVTILDIGAGYAPVSGFILDRYPHATCIGQDESEPMLRRARTLMERYGKRFTPHRSNLFERSWLPAQFGPFDAAVSSSCLHNLRDFRRIGEIYREVRGHLKSGGIFLNLDLVNAPMESGPFPADLDQQLAALRAAGFSGVDFDRQDLRRALVGGYA